jgi:hypothetical protein
MRWLGGAAALALLAAGTANAEIPGGITLQHVKTATGKMILQAPPRLLGPARYRDAYFDFSRYEETANPDGSIDDGSDGTSFPVRVAERGRGAMTSDISQYSCDPVAVVVGTTTLRVVKVTVDLADGTTSTIHPRRAPRAWHFRGRMFGHFYDGHGGITRTHALDAAGHDLGGAAPPPLGACDQS